MEKKTVLLQEIESLKIVKVGLIERLVKHILLEEKALARFDRYCLRQCDKSLKKYEKMLSALA